MNGWLVVAMTAVAGAVLSGLPPVASRRLTRVPGPVSSTRSESAGSRRWALAGGAGTVVVGWLLLPSAWAWLLPVLALPGAIAGRTIGRRIPSADSRAERRQRSANLPQALDLMAACLAAGLPLRSAATAVCATADDPVRGDLARVLHRLAIGVPDREAWLALADTAQWRPVARELARSVASGTGLVEVLRQSAEDVRQTHHTEQLQRARTVGVRSVLPLMVCYLPAFLLLGIVPIIGSAVLRMFE